MKEAEAQRAYHNNDDILSMAQQAFCENTQHELLCDVCSPACMNKLVSVSMVRCGSARQCYLNQKPQTHSCLKPHAERCLTWRHEDKQTEPKKKEECLESAGTAFVFDLCYCHHAFVLAQCQNVRRTRWRGSMPYHISRGLAATIERWHLGWSAASVKSSRALLVQHSLTSQLNCWKDLFFLSSIDNLFSKLTLFGVCHVRIEVTYPMKVLLVAPLK